MLIGLVRSGIALNPFDIFWSIITFSQDGFFMRPIEYSMPFLFALFIYTLALVHSLLAIRFMFNANNNENHYKKNIMLFILAVMGFGTYLYFVGRSQFLTVFQCSWPAFIIIAIFIADLFAYLKKHITKQRENGTKIKKLPFSLAAIFFSALLFLFTMLSLSNVTSMGTEQYSSYLEERQNARSLPAWPALSVINKYKVENMAIISYYSSYYGAYLNVNNDFQSTALLDFFFVDDYIEMGNFLKTYYGGRVFVDPF